MQVRGFDTLWLFAVHLVFLTTKSRKSMRWGYIFMTILVLGILGCQQTDPKDTPIPARTQDLPHIQNQVKRLDEGERKLLAGYILRHTFSHGMEGVEHGYTYVPEGTTIGQAIEEQKRFVRTPQAPTQR